MEYTIQRAPESLGEPTADWDHPLWATADTLEIALYRWEDSGHHPPTRVRALYDDEHLAVIFRVEDRFVRAVAEKFGDPVSADSCVEFFLSPFPAPIGAARIGQVRVPHGAQLVVCLLLAGVQLLPAKARYRQDARAEFHQDQQ